MSLVLERGGKVPYSTYGHRVCTNPIAGYDAFAQSRSLIRPNEHTCQFVRGRARVTLALANEREVL